MNIKKVGSHQTELETSTLRVLFSYRTPVAAFILGRGYVCTEHRWSATTSRHIKKWLNGVTAVEVSQAELDRLMP